MNYNDHLPPHFHAEYQDYEVSVEIATGEITGKIPRRALNLVWTWLDEHQDELIANWENARQHKPLRPVAPLK